MINIHLSRDNSGTTISIHQGEGTLDETMVMQASMIDEMADAVIGDFLIGAVTVHGVGT